ncbi:MAG: DUF4430 domain-containing protein [Peptococcaceae bacterium]|nr:DUF4430 domain-containing protein [Peptococcaceae bacterium]
MISHIKKKPYCKVGLMVVLLFVSILFSGCSQNHQIALESEVQCSISISCSTALEHAEQLPDGVLQMLPEDGWILEEITVPIQEGDTVFDVLLRTVLENDIHMEYVDTPVYDSAYIEGIANLYEFDAGEQSGWMYSVNEEFPNYGCSSYQVKDGDVICWVYTCNLGTDVRGETI